VSDSGEVPPDSPANFHLSRAATLCWLLSTSVQEIGILHAVEHASLPKHVRCEYHQQRPFCSFSLASCLFSRRRGSIREVCVHFDQATNLFQLSRAPRTFFALDQTIDDFPGARNACRHDQRNIRPAFRSICSRFAPLRARGQTWRTFLHNHAAEEWACDFLQVTDLFFRPLFAFFIIELKSRKVIHVKVTRTPTDPWVAQ